MTETERNPILIAIDRGYGNMKTPTFIFPTDVTEYRDEPAMAVVTLCWVYCRYTIGDTHKEFIINKTVDEDHLKLVVEAISKELNMCGLTEAPVRLAVGLPLTRASRQKGGFIRYISLGTGDRYP